MRIKFNNGGILVRRYVSLVVLLVLLVTPTVSASNASVFIDVLEDAWYLSELDYALEKGFISGTSPNTFSPNSVLTRGQFVTILGRIFGQRIDSYDTVVFDDVAPDAWYAPYISWAYQNGYVSGVDARHFKPNASITFEQMAAVLDNIIETTGVVLPEAPVEYNDSYSASLWAESSMAAMQKYGLIMPDSEGNLNPSQVVTRADGVVSISLLIKAIESSFDVGDRDDPMLKRDIFSQFIVGEPQFYTGFDQSDKSYWLSNIGYMLQNDLSTAQLGIKYETGNKAFASAVSDYRMFGCRISVFYNSENSRLAIERPNSGANYDSLSAALQVHNYLESNVVVTPDMSDLERARAYYDWLIENCEYDHSVVESNNRYHVSHTAYGAFVNKKAVCDGYTSAFNLLLSLDNIKNGVVRSDDPAHVWSEFIVDGVTYHADVTWGDTSGDVDKYFAMKPSVALARFQ